MLANAAMRLAGRATDSQDRWEPCTTQAPASMRMPTAVVATPVSPVLNAAICALRAARKSANRNARASGRMRPTDRDQHRARVAYRVDNRTRWLDGSQPKDRATGTSGGCGRCELVVGEV